MIRREIRVAGILKSQAAVEFLPEEEIRNCQWRKMKSLLAYAYDHVPFYRKRFASLGITPLDVRTWDDFHRLPMLTREDVLHSADELISRPKEELIKTRSGGSTGHPLVIYTHAANYHVCWALDRRANGWIGAGNLWPAFVIWGVTAKNHFPPRAGWARWMAGALPREYTYAFATVTEESLATLASDFLYIRPRRLYGYVSLVHVLADYINERKFRITRPPQAVIVTSETCEEEERKFMEDVFQAPVYIRYGSAENTTIASECRYHGLHVMADHVYLEINRDRLSSIHDGFGYSIATDLDNRIMPFIRYRNEDIMAWADTKCPCGRNLPLLEKVYGRDTDFIFDKNGKAYPGINLMRPLRPVAGNGAIDQLQIVQDRIGEAGLLIVPGRNYDASVGQRLVDAFYQEFKGQIQLKLSLVDDIPREPSGKFRFTKSKISLKESLRSS